MVKRVEHLEALIRIGYGKKRQSNQEDEERCKRCGASLGANFERQHGMIV